MVIFFLSFVQNKKQKKKFFHWINKEKVPPMQDIALNYYRQVFLFYFNIIHMSMFEQNILTVFKFERFAIRKPLHAI